MGSEEHCRDREQQRTAWRHTCTQQAPSSKHAVWMWGLERETESWLFEKRVAIYLPTELRKTTCTAPLRHTISIRAHTRTMCMVRSMPLLSWFCFLVHGNVARTALAFSKGTASASTRRAGKHHSNAVSDGSYLLASAQWCIQIRSESPRIPPFKMLTLSFCKSYDGVKHRRTNLAEMCARMSCQSQLLTLSYRASIMPKTHKQAKLQCT